MNPSVKHVFISYARKDRSFVDGLANRLEKSNVSVWYDSGLRAGTDWPDELAEQLRNARACIVVFTPQSVKSKWVKEEIHYAQNSVQIPVVPILLRDCQPPFGFSRTNYIDFRSGRDGFNELLTALGQPLSASFPPNPFAPLAGRITDPNKVFDREKEIKQAMEFLEAGKGIALIGSAGVGKSSLLTKLMAFISDHKKHNWEQVYLDLEVLDDEKDFYQAFCEKLGIVTCKGYSLIRALQGRQILLCLDEVEKMRYKGFTRNLRDQLRGLAESDKLMLKLILAARTPLDRLFPDSEGMTSPLANLCHQVDVLPWDNATSAEFINDRLLGTGMGFSANQKTLLINQSNGYPNRLMRAGFELYQQLTGGIS